MLSQNFVERLSKLGSKDGLITSLYLNVDLEHKRDYRLVLKDLIKDRRDKLPVVAKKRRLSKQQVTSIGTDFQRIEDFVQHEWVADANCRGLVVFSSHHRKLWEVIELPHSVESYLNVDHDPYIRPLSELLSKHKSYAVLLIDSAKAKIFDVTVGLLREHLVIQDQVSSRVKSGGFEGTQEKKLEHAREEELKKHYKHVSQELEELFRGRDFEWLILGGAKQIISQFEPYLSRDLRKKTIGHLVVSPDAPLNTVLEKARGIARKAEEAFEEKLIGKLRQETFSNSGKGVYGLQPTLQALRRGSVDTLIISRILREPGFLCHDCFFIGTKGESSSNACPVCGATINEVEDVIDEAITYSYMQGCKVEHTEDHGRLKMMENIGAILRF